MNTLEKGSQQKTFVYTANQVNALDGLMKKLELVRREVFQKKLVMELFDIFREREIPFDEARKRILIVMNKKRYGTYTTLSEFLDVDVDEYDKIYHKRTNTGDSAELIECRKKARRITLSCGIVNCHDRDRSFLMDDVMRMLNDYKYLYCDSCGNRTLSSILLDKMKMLDDNIPSQLLRFNE